MTHVVDGSQGCALFAVIAMTKACMTSATITVFRNPIGVLVIVESAVRSPKKKPFSPEDIQIILRRVGGEGCVFRPVNNYDFLEHGFLKS